MNGDFCIQILDRQLRQSSGDEVAPEIICEWCFDTKGQ